MPNNISPFNLLFMLAYAFDLNWNYLDKRAKRVDKTDCSFFDLLSFVLTKWVEMLIKEGLYKGFLDIEDVSNKLRGRILFNEYIQRYLEHTNKLCCRFDDLSFDTLENRIMLATLQHCKTVLNNNQSSGTVEARKKRQEIVSSINRIEKLLFPHISSVILLTQLFNQLQIYRANIKYKPILSLCHYIYRRSILKIEGEDEFVEPSDDKLSEIFERFLRNYLAEHLGVKGVRVDKTTILDWLKSEYPKGTSCFPSIKPDIVIWKNHKPCLVIDAKFYKSPVYKIMSWPTEREEIDERYKTHSHNIYQIIAYSEYFNCDGWIVYAQTESGPLNEVAQINRKHYINGTISRHNYRIFTIDLTGELDELKARMNKFKSMVIDCIQQSESDMESSQFRL